MDQSRRRINPRQAVAGSHDAGGPGLPRAAAERMLQHMCLAIPGKVTSVSGDDELSRVGKIDFGGIQKEVSLAYVPEANVGDYVIVHVGFSISRLDEAEANQVFEYLRQMEELAELHPDGPPPSELRSPPAAVSTPRPAP